MSDNGKVVLAYCHPGEVDGFFHQSVMNLIMADGRRKPGAQRILCSAGGYINEVSGPRIAAARNTLVRSFLHSGVFTADWLLMLDTDMVFNPDLLDQLMEVADAKERPIVGGLCFAGGRTDIFPTLYRIVKTDGDGHYPMEKITNYPQNAVIRVDATGAACLLMHRKALLKIEEHYGDPVPWFAESIYLGHEFGEDITFCLRAQSVGLPIFVHTGARLGHVKPRIIDENTFFAYRHAVELAKEQQHETAQESRLFVPKRELEVVGSV